MRPNANCDRERDRESWTMLVADSHPLVTTKADRMLDSHLRARAASPYVTTSCLSAAMRIGYIIASNKVALERRPVAYLYREVPDNENDSGWRVFSGHETQEFADDAANFAMYNPATILEIDPSVAPLLGAPPPVTFERDASGQFVEVRRDG